MDKKVIFRGLHPVGFSDHLSPEEVERLRRELKTEFRRQLDSRRKELRGLPLGRRISRWFQIRKRAWREAFKTVLGEELPETPAFGELFRGYVDSRAQELEGLSGLTRLSRRWRIYYWAAVMTSIDRGFPVEWPKAYRTNPNQGDRAQRR